MKKLPLAAALACAVAAPVAVLSAQDQQIPGAMDPARITGGTYRADPSHTLVQWRVDHLGFNPYFGLFGDIAGTLSLDPRNIAAAKVDITVPIANVTVASEGLKAHLLRAGEDGAAPDFFGPEPGMAHFVSTKVTRLGADRALIEGQLTMIGHTGPVVLLAELSGAGRNPRSGVEMVGFTATTTIDRSDWGLTYGIPMVSDAVDLKITAAFEKQ